MWITLVDLSWSYMLAPASEAWLGNDAFPVAVGALWAAMALEGRCLRRGSLAMIRKTHERHPKKPTLAQVTSTLLSRTRLHGLRHVCLPGGSVGRRAFWLLALCTSLGLLLSWSSNRLLHWLSFPTYTRVHTEWAKELPFPAVTICNNNPIRLYKLTKNDLYFAGHWLGLLLANRTVRPLVLDLLQEDRRAWFRKLSDFSLFLPPRNFEGTNLEFMDRLSHQLDDMLLSCKYKGEPCGAHNFSSVSPSSSVVFSGSFVPTLPAYKHPCSTCLYCKLLPCCYCQSFQSKHQLHCKSCIMDNNTLVHLIISVRSSALKV